MRYFVLDTNIIIRDPSVITVWSPNFRIIVPDIVIEEISILKNKHNKNFNKVFAQLEESLVKEMIIKTHISNFALKDNKDNLDNSRLSRVDLILASYTKGLLTEGKDAVLVTHDRALQDHALTLGVKTINLSQLRQELFSSKVTKVEEIGEAQTIIEYQKNRSKIGLVLAARILVITLTGFYFRNFIFNTFHVWGPIVIPLAGFALYWFRCKTRLHYGMVECVVGFLYSGLVVQQNLNNKSFDSVENLKIIAALYIIVRGLDNISAGLKGSLVEPRWRKFFGDNV